MLSFWRSLALIAIGFTLITYYKYTSLRQEEPPDYSHRLMLLESEFNAFRDVTRENEDVQLIMRAFDRMAKAADNDLDKALAYRGGRILGGFHHLKKEEK